MRYISPLFKQRVKNMISFSIVTVVLNDLEGLKRTQRSISKLEGAVFEWIVYDGGSGANTTDFLTSLGRDVKWVSMADQGIYDAMNRGVALCSGEYVVFMNAGDTFHDSNTLAQALETLSANNQVADILFGGAMLSFPNSGRMHYRPPRHVTHSLWHGLPANHQATYYRKTLLEITPYDLQYRLCGDYYLTATLINKGAYAVYLDHPLAIFEVGGLSLQRRKEIFVELYRIQRDILGIPIHYRLASMAKRFVSITGAMLLSR